MALTIIVLPNAVVVNRLTFHLSSTICSEFIFISITRFHYHVKALQEMYALTRSFTHERVPQIERERYAWHDCQIAAVPYPTMECHRLTCVDVGIGYE